MKRNVKVFVIEGEEINMQLSKYDEYENGLITVISCANNLLYENGQITFGSASKAAKFYLTHTLELDEMFNRNYSEYKISSVKNSVLKRYYKGTTLETIVELHYDNYLLTEYNNKLSFELRELNK